MYVCEDRPFLCVEAYGSKRLECDAFYVSSLYYYYENRGRILSALAHSAIAIDLEATQIDVGESAYALELSEDVCADPQVSS